MRYPFKSLFFLCVVSLAAAKADRRDVHSYSIITPPPIPAAAPIGFAAMPLPRIRQRQVASCLPGYELCGDQTHCCRSSEVCFASGLCASGKDSCPTAWPVFCRYQGSETLTRQCCIRGATCSYSFNTLVSSSMLFCEFPSEVRSVIITHVTTRERTVTVSPEPATTDPDITRATDASLVGTPTNKKPNNKGGMIAGVTVGVIAVLCGIVVAVWHFVIRRKKRNYSVTQQPSDKEGYEAQRVELSAPVPPPPPSDIRPQHWSAGEASEHFPPDDQAQGVASTIHNNSRGEHHHSMSEEITSGQNGYPSSYNNPQFQQ